MNEPERTRETRNNEADKLEAEFRKVWKGGYLDADIEVEMEWRFSDVRDYLLPVAVGGRGSP